MNTIIATNFVFNNYMQAVISSKQTQRMASRTNITTVKTNFRSVSQRPPPPPPPLVLLPPKLQIICCYIARFYVRKWHVRLRVIKDL